MASKFSWGMARNFKDDTPYRDMEERVQRASDEAVEDEIRRLKASPYVRLARHEQEIREAKIRLRDELRALEHRGQKLAEQGWSLEELGGDDAED